MIFHQQELIYILQESAYFHIFANHVQPLVTHLRIDNTGRSVIPVIGACSETIHGRITCDMSNNRASVDINYILIIVD